MKINYLTIILLIPCFFSRYAPSGDLKRRFNLLRLFAIGKTFGMNVGYFYSQEANLKELNGRKENISRFDFSLGKKFYM
jgi:hypothetical protein